MIIRFMLAVAGLAAALFCVNFLSFVYAYRFLTDDMLSEDQKSENAAIVFGPVLVSFLGLSILVSILIVVIFRRRSWR
jgi:hypothetical protein